MRAIPLTERVPHRINRFLLPYETRIITVHPHPFRIIPSLVTATGGLLAAVTIGPLTQANRVLELIIWLLVAMLLAQLALTVAHRSTRYVVVTSARLFICSGLLASDITFSTPLEFIRDIRLTRSFAGRLYGYGTLVLPSQHVAIDYVPYPEQLYLEILGLLFSEGRISDES